MERPPIPGKNNAKSVPSMFPPSSSGPESTSSETPPSYSNPSQYPPASGMSYPQQYPAQGYPQPYAPQNGGQPYYPQQGAAYPGQAGFNNQAPQPQQQQHQVIVVNNRPASWSPIYLMNQTSAVSMTGAIVLSCIAFWCFGWVFGLIGFILAMVGQSSAIAGDINGAIRLRKASYGVSIAGIVVGVIVIAAVVAVNVTATRVYYSSCTYTYNYYTRNYIYGCK